MNDWIKTDDDQIVRKISDNCFEVIEAILVAPLEVEGVNHYGISRQTIYLDDYSEEDIIDELSYFGYDSIKHVRELYGEDANQIIAECIAEMNPERMEETFDEIEDALSYIETEIIKEKVFSM